MVKSAQHLLSKVARPSADGLLPRERLFVLLDRFRRRPITWVEGPPGAGKTSLVSSWIEARSLPCLWYQVDAGDADPATFFHYLRNAAPKGVQPLAALTPEYLPDLAGFTRRFFRTLGERLPPQSVIVLDNFQEVSEGAPLGAIARDGAAILPDGVTLVLLSRTLPPVAFAEAIAHADLARLRWDDLRLDVEETRRVAGVPIDRARALHERTGGWAAGLRLVLESRNGASVSADVADAPEAVFEYLAAEVFDRSPSALRELWLATALLRRFTPEMARAMTGWADVGARLEELVSRRYFIERHGDAESAYQYHALFQSFLRRQLARQETDAKRRALAHRSAELLENAGETETAFQLYCEAEDFAAAVPLILRAAPGLLAQGRWQTLRAALTTLPAPLLEKSPWLLYWLGASQGMTDPPLARTAIERAYHRFLESGDRMGQAMSASTALETYFAYLDHLPELDKWLEAAERAVAAGVEFPDPAAALRFWGNLLVALGYRRPGGSLEEAAIEKVWELLPRAPGFNDKLIAGSQLLHHLVMFGDAQAANRLATELETWLDRLDTAALARVPASWSICMNYLALHRFEDALRVIRACEQIVAEHGFGFAADLTGLFEAWVLAYSGDHEAAAAHLAGCAPSIARARKNEIALFNFLSAWFALSRHEPQAALSFAQVAQSTIAECETSGPAVHVHNALALAAAECGDHARALDALAIAHRWVDGREGGSFRTLVLLVDASVHLRAGAQTQGRAALAEAFARLRRSGSLYTWIWLPDLMSRLCAEALDAGIQRETALALIRERGLRAPSPDCAAWPWPIRIHTLGRFEVAVNDQVLRHARKAQRRVLDLLKAIVALGPDGVSRDAVAAALWPDSEGDAARDAFEVTLHRLRKLLGRDDAVQLSHGILHVNHEIAWTDAASFERLAANGEHGELNVDAAERAFALYAGPFLQGEDDAPWLLPTRERLRSRYLRLATRLGRHLEHAGSTARAVEVYSAALEAEPLAEELYRRLMTALAAQGRRAEAIDVYRRCRHMLAVVLGAAPSRETEAAHAAISRAA